MKGRFGPTVWLLAACVVGAFPLTASAGDDGVVVIQESNGFPGGEKSNTLSRQQVTVQDGKLRILDTAHMWALFIDLDERKVREAAVDLKEYSERSFTYYNRYRKDRTTNLKAQAEEWLRKKKRLEAKGDDRRLRQHVNEYRKIGGDPKSPGRIVARLQYYPQDRKTDTILVDRVETEVVLEHYVIRENQCDRPIFDLWTTHSVKLPTDLFRFYRELGTFSPEVSKKLQEIPGTVIRCVAVLDTGSFTQTFRSQVLELRLTEPARGALSVPAGWSKVDPDRRPVGPTPPTKTTKTCAICGVTIQPGKERRFKRQYACSTKHRIELIKRFKKKR
jgi:hypothetical protein